MKKPLIIITGPTACGKTTTSIEFAKLINGEIISADSMQIYKYMDIGTAKVTPDEMKGVKHYLVDEIYPDEPYSVAIFQKKAKQYMDEIYSKGKIPVIVGGTGFYINAIIYDNFFENYDENNNLSNKYREEFSKVLYEKGREYLYDLLKEVDLQSTNTIHMNNTKRVIRALEFCKLTGKKFSEHNKIEKSRQLAYDVKTFVLNMDRELLYSRINKRVDIMISNNLVEEVKKLLKMGYNKNLVSMQGLGYKEIVWYLNNEITLDEAIYIIKRDTRHFAKRQLTWFKHQLECSWINVENFIDCKEIAHYLSDNCS